MSRLPGDDLRAGDAFVLGLVRQHGTGDDVADRVNALHAGRKMRIDLDPAAIVERDPGFLQPEALGVGHASDADQHHVGLHCFRAAARGRLDLAASVGPDVSTPVTLAPSLKAKPCFSRMRWNCLAISPSIPGKIRSRNSTTVTSAPSRCHTEPSSSPITPAPTTNSLPGTLSSASAPVDDTMRFSSISMPFSRATSEPVAITMFLVSTSLRLAVAAGHLDLAGAEYLAHAADDVDLVLLHQELDALDVAVDALLLEVHHRRQIELRRRRR